MQEKSRRRVIFRGQGAAEEGQCEVGEADCRLRFLKKTKPEINVVKAQSLSKRGSFLMMNGSFGCDG